MPRRASGDALASAGTRTPLDLGQRGACKTCARAPQYTGHADAAGVEKVLRSDLKGMFERRFNKDEYEQYDEKFIVQARGPAAAARPRGGRWRVSPSMACAHYLEGDGYRFAASQARPACIRGLETSCTSACNGRRQGDC